MGGNEEQRYVCKICGKSCASGKSLGGHMRIHLALISASKKAAKAKIKIEDDQSNSALPTEEDGDQNNYELRENPKKSWRISDPKHGGTKNRKSCKQCEKDFPSLRALSGHMRCHSIKKKSSHQCKKCGKEFGSIKAMFGHMKSHPKRLRNVADDSTDNLSDLEHFCPVRRKRSRIRYKSSPNPSCSDLNVSNSAVDELGEAATCLIMLSRGVNDCSKLDYDFGTDQSSFRSKKFSENGRDTVSNQLECCNSGYAHQNLTEFDDLDSKFIAEDQVNADTEASDDDLDCDAGWVSVHKVMEPEQSEGSRSCGSAESDECSSELFESKKVISSAFQSDSENKPDLEEHLEKRPKYKPECRGNQESTSKEHRCPTCSKVFPSGQALGGHKRAHYYRFTETKSQEPITAIQQVARVCDLNFATTVDHGEVGIHSMLVEETISMRH